MRARQSMTPQIITASIACGVLTVAIPCNAAPNGKAFAQATVRNAIPLTKVTLSSLAIGPPFRTLHLRYPVESLEEALGEGIVTGHPSMPEFRLDPGQVGDFIIFLKSLEP
jgi:cytochrome c